MNNAHIVPKTAAEQKYDEKIEKAVETVNALAGLNN